MHETGLVRDLVRRVERAARDAGAVRIEAVSVWLGALSQFSAEHFREHFAEEARDTIAEHAELEIEVSDDVRDPDAQAVMIRSLRLEIPDEAG